MMIKKMSETAALVGFSVCCGQCLSEMVEQQET